MKSDDRFVLSKGHAAGSLYVALWTRGLLSDDDLNTFCCDNSLLAGHPHGSLPSVCFPTGSLGHGPSLACGMAMAAKHKRSDRHIWCLCGDGEWQEGSCWEALSFASHHKLKNITIIIDVNGLQGFGSTEQVNSFGDFAARLESFGAEVVTADGHDPVAVRQALSEKPIQFPKVILMRTIKGKGLSNQGEVSSHYLPLSKDEYESLMAQEEADA